MFETKLPIFNNFEFNEETAISVLQSNLVEKISVFALGPEGTNIEQASRAWSEKLDVALKTEIHLEDTPYHALEHARTVTDSKEFPIIVTCAVYNRLNNLYFSNHDCCLFFHHLYMKLDNMQLAARENVTFLPDNWAIATHPSPRPLLAGLPNTIIETNSNSYSAKLCREGKVDCCITTESARSKYSLVNLHTFGSPMMLFLFGTTNHGTDIYKSYINGQI